MHRSAPNRALCKTIHLRSSCGISSDAVPRALQLDIMGWLFYACLSAVASALTAILAKLGVEQVPTSLAVVYRTVVVLLITGAVALSLGEFRAFATVSRRSLVFLTLSGAATGIAWFAYFKALQLGPASRVAPVDKLSLPIAIVLAAVVLHETLTWKLALGVALMTIGALLTIA